jgi:hypothetical protein
MIVGAKPVVSPLSEITFRAMPCDTLAMPIVMLGVFAFHSALDR